MCVCVSAVLHQPALPNKPSEVPWYYTCCDLLSTTEPPLDLSDVHPRIAAIHYLLLKFKSVHEDRCRHPAGNVSQETLDSVSPLPGAAVPAASSRGARS